MHVNVEQPGGDDEVGHIDDAVGVAGGNVLLDPGDAAVEYTDVADAVELVGGIDDMAAFE